MKNKIIKLFAVASVALCANVANAQWTSQGFVFCDANSNNIVDLGDVPLPGVRVVVTNVAGGYGTNVLTGPLGGFQLNVTNIPGTYRTFITGLSNVVILPPAFTNTFGAGLTNVTNIFFVRATNCSSLLPTNTACWLRGGGAIKSPGGKGKPLFTFGVSAAPNCDSPNEDDFGHFNLVAHSLKLHFKGEVFELTNCGGTPGTNFIEFHGVGTVKGIAGSKQDYGLVHFTGRAEDLGEGTDRLYLRVYTDIGQTLIVISGQPNNPMVVAPIPVTNGEIEIHRGTCANPPDWEMEENHED